MPEVEQQTQLIQIDPIVAKIKDYVPRMSSGRDKAVARMTEQLNVLNETLKTFDGTPSDDINEIVESVNQTLLACKSAYEKFNEWRTEITGPFDEFKKQIMEYEKAVSPDGKTDNNYTALRKGLVEIENRKREKVRAAEAEAQRKKEIENYKVDIATAIKKKLANMVMERVVEVDDGASKFFASLTLDEFDAKAKQFNTFKPKLKPERYEVCFQIPVDAGKISEPDFKALIEKLKADEPYDKWAALEAEGITPILNNWRAKLPDRKEELIALKNAKSQEEALALEEKQKQEAEAEQKRKTEEFAKVQQQAETQINSEAEMSKMNNEFVAQISTQGKGELAPVKWYYVVQDETKLVKALAVAIYHSMASDKFPGIYKVNTKTKMIVVDDQGNKVLRDEIDWWFKFCAQYCDVDIEGMVLKETSKIMVKK